MVHPSHSQMTSAEYCDTNMNFAYTIYCSMIIQSDCDCIVISLQGVSISWCFCWHVCALYVCKGPQGPQCLFWWTPRPDWAPAQSKPFPEFQWKSPTKCWQIRRRWSSMIIPNMGWLTQLAQRPSLFGWVGFTWFCHPCVRQISSADFAKV